MNDTGKSTGNIPTEFTVISEISCFGAGEAASMITKLHTLAKLWVGKSPSRLSGIFDNWRAHRHKIKANTEVLFFSRPVEKKWRFALFFMYSGLMFKNCNDFSQQNAVRIPGLILRGCDSPCCVMLVVLQRRAWRASHWQCGIRALASLQY